MNCRQLFINQANTEQIGRSEVQLLGKALNYKGQIAILSAASTATNQNAWIAFMQKELKLPKYKNMKLVKIYYGNDNPAQSLQATESMLQAYPNLKGIISPTTVGISSAAQYLDHSKYKGKVVLTGLGLPSQMKKYVLDGTVKPPSSSGTRRTWATSPATRRRRSPRATSRARSARRSRPASSASTRSSRAPAGRRSCSGLRIVFNKSNVAKFNF